VIERCRAGVRDDDFLFIREVIADFESSPSLPFGRSAGVRNRELVVLGLGVKAVCEYDELILAVLLDCARKNLCDVLECYFLAWIQGLVLCIVILS
jgi:hypothetical protein